MKIVRLSKMEETMPNYCGSDAVIDLPIDFSKYNEWIGDELKIVSVRQRMKKFPINTQYDFYTNLVSGFNSILYGFDNEDIPQAKSNATDAEIRESLQHSRVSYCGCTRPAPLTYTFRESLAAGCPTITVGPNIGNFIDYSHGKMYEQHKYIEQGVNGFYSDNIQELRQYIQLLFDDYDLAKKISNNGIITARNNWNIEKITNQWRCFFNSFGVLP